MAVVSDPSAASAPFGMAMTQGVRAWAAKYASMRMSLLLWPQ
jgi:hypothetical protein